MEIIGVVLTVLIFIAFGVLFLAFLASKKFTVTSPKAAGGISNEFAIGKWTEIKSMLQTGGPANYRQSIVEADKLVDSVLSSLVPGSTMGERLKSARRLFPQDIYNNLWSAHKIRNRVVHEVDFEGLSSDASMAVKYFENALKHLKLI